MLYIYIYICIYIYRRTLWRHVISYMSSSGIDTRPGRSLGLFFNDNKLMLFFCSVDHVSSDKFTSIADWLPQIRMLRYVLVIKWLQSITRKGWQDIAPDTHGIGFHRADGYADYEVARTTPCTSLAIRHVAEVFHCTVLNSFTALYSHFVILRYLLGYSSEDLCHCCLLKFLSFHNLFFVLCNKEMQFDYFVSSTVAYAI